jgi:hypothetical protein
VSETWPSLLAAGGALIFAGLVGAAASWIIDRLDR